MDKDVIERLIGNEVGINSRLTVILCEAIADGKLDVFEAQAVARAVKYSDQIADVSIGNTFRDELSRITSRA